MSSFLQKARELFSQASYRRTFTILSVLVLLAAIPLTVYVAQQQQEIRQRASESGGICVSLCQDQDAACRGSCQRLWERDYQNADAAYDTCVRTCDIDGGNSACYNTCDTQKQSAYSAADTALNSSCLPSCNNMYTQCRQQCESTIPPPAGGETAPPPPGNSGNSDTTYRASMTHSCSGTSPQFALNWNIPNVFGGNSCNIYITGPGGGVYQIGKTCSGNQTLAGSFPEGASIQNHVAYTFWVSNGQENPSTWFNAPKETVTPNCSSTTTPPPAAPPTVDRTVPSGSVGTCRPNPVNPPAGYEWRANCGGPACSQNSQCPQNTSDPGYVNPATSNWCYGFEGPNNNTADWRCLQLHYVGPRGGTPTPPPGQGTPAACSATPLSASVVPSTIKVGDTITFSLGGSNGSTHVVDEWSGGVTNCTGPWNNKTCTAASAGSFTWTHKWRNCLGSFDNCSTTVCSHPTNFTIASASPGDGTPPPAAGDVQLAFTLSLDAIFVGRTDLKTPNRNLTVELYNSAGALVGQARSFADTLRYNSQTGKFTATVNMGQVAAGDYTVKVKSNRYLKKLIPGILTIPAAPTTPVAARETNLIAGDINMVNTVVGDNKIDVLDYNALRDCFGAKVNATSCASKTNADLDDDGKVDEVDFNILIRSFVFQKGD